MPPRAYHSAVTVYIELVLFNNFAVDLLLEICTLTALGRKIPKFRCALGAAFGAAVATLYAIAPTVWQIVIKALLAPLMAAIFFKPKKGKVVARIIDFAGGTAVFCVLTFLAGGIVQGLGYLLGVDVSGYWALGLVATALIICILSARAIRKTRSGSAGNVKDVRLLVQGTSIDCKALCDSGNILVDELSGLPVIIISNRIGDDLTNCRREGFIDVKTVNGSGCLPLVKLDGVEIEGKTLGALGAISEANIEGCDIILQASMF